jgi:hypothetical protein
MGTDVRGAAVMATEAWRGFPNVPDVVIEEGAPPAYNANKRGNAIYWLDKWPFESNQLAVTLVTYRQTGEVIGVDVLVNGSKNFKVFPEDDKSENAIHYDLAAVLTHEIGHVLGLGESYDHMDATMWPQIRTHELKQRSLDKRRPGGRDRRLRVADCRVAVRLLGRSFRESQRRCRRAHRARRNAPAAQQEAQARASLVRDSR